MAYEGYRIKINGNIFPNVSMQRGSWSCSSSPRLCESYTDARGIKHDIFYPIAKTEISFVVKEHNQTEHAELASFFSSRANVSVEYWDDNSGEYKNGTFGIKDFAWSHSNAGQSFIDYGATQITFEEY